MLSVSADRAVGALDPQPGENGKEAPEWRLLARLDKAPIGVRGADRVVTVRRREPAGCLLYGPYWQLPSGAYRLHFCCRSGTPRMPKEPVLGVEVTAMNRVQLAWLDLTEAELRGETGALEFSVPPVLGLGAGDEARLEFRFFHMGNADLAIFAVDLHAAGIGETRPAPPRIWRMLGRLEKTAIGKRTAQGIVVRRAERAGRLLDGGRPLLQLPKGHYRLTVHCDARTPRMASAPVLGVEIIARRRWREGRLWSAKSLLGLPAGGGAQQAWADFTMAQLRAGPGEVEFAVPAELSLESGQDILFDLRFVHLGNADLMIGAVELRQAAERGPAASRQWRLLGRLRKGRIGTRAADSVTVRQTERAGCLLYGGCPTLRLPEGRYRLSFCCRAGPPRIASEPILSVEVSARKLSHAASPSSASGEGLGWELRTAWESARRFLFKPRSLLVRADFRAETLHGGSASVDFVVPAQPPDEQLGVEFSFLHLGNADLAISAVNLHDAADAAELSLRPSINSGRTKVLIVGNCQAQTVYEALLRTGELNLHLDPKYHFVGLQKDLHETGRADLDNCEVLLVQDIRDWENYPLREHIRDDVRIIKFPLLHFASLWPFDHYNGPGDKEAYEREWPNLTFLYQDGLLARLRREIPDPEQRLEAYRSLSVEGVVNYVRLHDFERRRLAAMDRQFGFAIGRFILNHFQQRRIFYTTNHPDRQIFVMLMQYLLGQLGINRVFRPNASLDHLRRLQVPVHPKVAKALGVRWAGENTRYLYGGEHITWENYTRRYIDHYG